MAKPKKAKIRLSVPDTKVTTLPVTDSNGLPSYKPYVDCRNHTFRCFFESPSSSDEVVDNKYPDKSYLRAGKKYSKSNRSGFLLVGDGAKLVGTDIAKTFAQLLIKKVTNFTYQASSVTNQHTTIKSFFDYISSLDSPPKRFNSLTIHHISKWLESLEKTSTAKSHKANIKLLLDLHPIGETLKLDAIKFIEKSKPAKDLSKIDFDKVVGQNDYSDKELIQILSYVFYEIEKTENHLKQLDTTTIEELGDDYIAIDSINVKNKKMHELFNSGEDGHLKLLKNLYIYIKNEKNGVRKVPSRSDYQYFMSRLQSLHSRKYKNEHNPFNDFSNFLCSLAWPLRGGESGRVNYFNYLSQKTDHHELAILLYTLITTGLNLETVMSWKWLIKGKPWYENYDVALGITENSPQRDKSVLLVGKKNKGQGAAKIIGTTIKVNSPIYKYLKLLDRTRKRNREYIFQIKEVSKYTAAFTKHYKIIDDDENELKTIETRRLRKVFAGHKIIELLKDVKSADELVAKLREALNHDKFDTTLFSYIMKSGVGNLVINSAIVALTSDLLEKAVTFQGKIKQNSERSESSHKVFLCDCTDPSNPSHDLPIANKCRKYDMCLGCERSEVYKEHLPAICYRIMQYENKQTSDSEVFKATLEDRLYIARNTIEQFRVKHTHGEKLVEEAYLIANKAMVDNTPLLPTILQIGSV